MALRAEDENRWLSELHFAERLPTVRDEADTPPFGAAQRHAKKSTRRRSQRLRPGRIGASLRELDAASERVSCPDQSAEVARIRNTPERKGNPPRHKCRQIVPSEHRNNPRRMRQRRDFRQQLGQNCLTGDEQLDRLDPSLQRCLDEILALSQKHPELVAPAA